MTTVPATIQERITQPPAAGPAVEGAGGVSINEIFSILRRRVVMIILLWMLFGAMAVGLFFLWYIKFPGYQAYALIECISNRPAEGEKLVQDTPQDDEYERFINSEAQLVKSLTVLLDVLKTPEVRSTGWYRKVEESGDEHLLELEEALASVPMRDTNYIKVSIECTNPQDPAKIVNQVVNQYYRKVQDKAKEDYREQLKAYQDEEERLNGQVQQKIEQIRNFTAELPAGALTGTAGGVVYEELRLYMEQVAALELQTMELEGLQQLYNDPAGPGVSQQDMMLIEQNPMVLSLVNQQFALEQALWILLEKFGPEHREVKEYQRRLKVISRQLEEVRDRKVAEIVAYRREQIRTAYLNSQHALMLAQEQLAEAVAGQQDLDRKMAEYTTLNDELLLLKTQKARTSDFIREINRVVKERQTIRVGVVQKAIDPLEKSSPNVILLPVGVVMALVVAMGMALLVELTDTSVRTPQDIVRHLNVPMLGVVPDVDDEEVPIEQVETAVRDAPHSMMVEAFRTIRTNLQFSAPAERQRTIIVTSPRPEDGKTTVASNLAAALAQGGRRILLVDANFRRPALHRIYGKEGAKGLSNLLVGEGTLETLVRKTDIANLDVLLSGPIPPNPAERLASPQLREFLGSAVERYDQIIIDVPPVLLVSDAVVLSTSVDGAIVVCRAKENSRGAARRCCDLLLRVNAHLFGAVLNAAQVRRGGYFREQMATFYDYQPEEALTAGSKPALPSGRDRDQDEEQDQPPAEEGDAPREGR